MAHKQPAAAPAHHGGAVNRGAHVPCERATTTAQCVIREGYGVMQTKPTKLWTLPACTAARGREIERTMCGATGSSCSALRLPKMRQRPGGGGPLITDTCNRARAKGSFRLALVLAWKKRHTDPSLQPHRDTRHLPCAWTRNDHGTRWLHAADNRGRVVCEAWHTEQVSPRRYTWKRYRGPCTLEELQVRTPWP